MATFDIQANGNTFKSSGDPAEEVAIIGPSLRAGEDDYGKFAARPDAAHVTIVRKVPNGTGDVVLLRTAVESQLWNNRDGQEANWPTATLIMDRQEGNKAVAVQTTSVKRILVNRWSLTWSGEGPGGLDGVEFKESLAFRTYEIQKQLHDKNNTTVRVKLS